MTFYDDVRAFHRMWHEPPARPLLPHDWPNRVRLITEEFAELSKAYALKDIYGFADGVIDLEWVVIGTGVVAGLPYNKLWDEVTRANMDKRGGVVDSSGKLLKPPGWKPPNIKSIIDEAIAGDNNEQ